MANIYVVYTKRGSLLSKEYGEFYNPTIILYLIT